jgi:spermidine/putrescine ABC transporter ATP-binding subunit
MSDLRLEDVSVRYPSVTAMDRVTLRIAEGEFVALLGPSGCGKTTTIKVIAGFIRPDEGRVFIGRENVTHVPPHRRKVGMVFQNYALFPHKSVFGNVAFGLRMKKEDGPTIEKKVGEVLKILHLAGFENRYPHQLSGGQQQRVALARALVINPAVLLLDEPLGALDKKLREEMQIELRGLQKKFGITTVFVTHDQEEALTMADRIAILNKGEIEQVGSPSEIYDHPVNRFVSDFIGISNILQVGVVKREATRTHGQVEGLPLVIFGGGPYSEGSVLEVAIRPEKIELVLPSSAAGENVFSGMVERKIYRGAITLFYVKITDSVTLIVQEQNPGRRFQRVAVGDTVWVTWPPEACKVLNDRRLKRE